jgi:sugar phosphate permease
MELLRLALSIAAVLSTAFFMFMWGVISGWPQGFNAASLDTPLANYYRNNLRGWSWFAAKLTVALWGASIIVGFLA